mmetsp:Transcript_20942/g.37429  ORF Transcript_20942/g.37429 Transcript_20942/m.37429 type:complete len:112 (-) Transcript_20942:923-1258(-)
MGKRENQASGEYQHKIETVQKLLVSVNVAVEAHEEFYGAKDIPNLHENEGHNKSYEDRAVGNIGAIFKRWAYVYKKGKDGKEGENTDLQEDANTQDTIANFNTISITIDQH